MRAENFGNIVNVVFPIPHGGPYSYLAPGKLGLQIDPGVRVVAPLGKRVLTGVVTESGVVPPPGIRLRPIKEIIDERPLLSPDLIELALWISRYYFCDLGEALRAVVPGIFLRVGDRKIRFKESQKPVEAKLAPTQEKLLAYLESEREILFSRLRKKFSPADLRPHLARLAELGLVEIEDHLPRLPKTIFQTMLEAVTDPPQEELEQLTARKKRRRDLYETLKAMAHPVEAAHVTGPMGFSASVVNALVAQGLLKRIPVEAARDPFRNIKFPPYEAPVPSPAQAAAIERIRASLGRHEVFLLYGVTGSGKTLVYIELLKPVIRDGGQAIVLVPEIALTPQTTGRFRGVFGDQVAVLHSGLSDGERYDIWRQIREGRYSVAVGARSAVFAPFPRLKITIIDEEHEHTYKQSDTTPRYHAREVAIARMKKAEGPVVLGSATPSLESYHQASLGEYTLLELPERVLGLPLPAVHIHDLRRGWSKNKRSLVTEPLLKEIDSALASSGQVLLLLNRRGYNNFMICEECGHIFHCKHCQISLTVHRRLNRLLCHYCGSQQDIPAKCSACGSSQVISMGMGTEQVENILRERFPQRVIDRMDMDTTGGKWSHHEILERLRTGATQILVGTQMIAKGLDFPNVTLVGVVSADTAMNLPDFRANERTFQLLAQVAGRTGRSERGGEVFIQTFNPGHPSIIAAVSHDYQSFARGELAIRSEAGYPPYVELINVILSGAEEKTLDLFAEKTAAHLEKLAEPFAGRVTILGPAPCPLEKLRGRYRRHLIAKSASSEVLQEIGSRLSREIKPPGKGKCRLTLDRDPSSLM